MKKTEVTERQKLVAYAATRIYVQDCASRDAALGDGESYSIDEVMTEAVIDAERLISLVLEEDQSG
jgi:hypothetical protein